MFTFKNQSQSIWGIISDGFRLYSASISKIWYWQIIFMLPIIIISILLNYIANLVGVDKGSSLTAGFITFSVLTSIFTLIISIFAHCFVYNRMHAIGVQGDSTTKASIDVAIRKTWPILGGLIVLLIIIAIITAPALLIMINVLNVNFITLLLSSVLLYLVSVCICLFILLFPLFILFDNKGILQSMKSSITHMWGNFWRTLFMLILMSILLLAVVLAIVLPLQILITLISAGAPTVGIIIGFITIPLAYLGMYAFIVPIFDAIILSLYHDLKVRKAASTNIQVA